jgi:hypothetical protein
MGWCGEGDLALGRRRHRHGRGLDLMALPQLDGTLASAAEHVTP